MNHAFLIMAYNNPSLLGRICHRLEADNHFLFVHIDKKTELVSFRNACQGIHNLILLGDEERMVTNWGGVFATCNRDLTHKEGYTTFLAHGLPSFDKWCRLSLSK